MTAQNDHTKTRPMDARFQATPAVTHTPTRQDTASLPMLTNEQAGGFDPARYESIKNAMDPLAIVGLFLYSMSNDIWKIEFSNDTILWFVAAASAVRSWISRWIERMLAAHRESVQHSRELQLRRLARNVTDKAESAVTVAKEILAMHNSHAENSGIADKDGISIDDSAKR